MTTQSPSELEIFSTGLSVASACIQKFTYPLIRLDDRKVPEVFASCVFVRVNDAVYLVTAAHALREKHTSLLTRGKNHLFPLSGRGTVSRDQGVDNFDIGSIRIDDKVVDEQGLEVVPWNNLSLAVEVQNPHSRAICGFPVSMNKQFDLVNRNPGTFTGKCMTYFGFSGYDGEFLPFKKSPNVHIGLDYLSGTDDKGRALTSPPSPRGISGGGSWLIPDIHRPELVFLEGIFIECHPVRKPRYAFSTRLEHVFDFVSQTHNKTMQPTR